MSGSYPEKYHLTGSFTPPETGLYTLKVRNRRNAYATSLLINYIDNITLVPRDYTLGSDGVTFSCVLSTTRNFTLNAGPHYGGHDYIMMLGFSETYPGLNMGGANIPLNWDLLVQLSMFNPGFPGPGFLGKLDGNGQATASMTCPTDMMLLGRTFFFTYAVLSPGGNLPIVLTGNPINATVTVVE